MVALICTTGLPDRAEKGAKATRLLSESDDTEDNLEVIERSKRKRYEDKLSLSPSEADIDTHLGVYASETKEADDAESTNRVANANETYLKSLETDLNEDDPVGEKIEQHLANIALKRWRISLSDNKLKEGVAQQTDQNLKTALKLQWPKSTPRSGAKRTTLNVTPTFELVMPNKPYKLILKGHLRHLNMVATLCFPTKQM